MSIRTIRQFRASRSSTIIALLFSIASGASTLAGVQGHAGTGDDMHADTGHAPWQEKRGQAQDEQRICSL